MGGLGIKMDSILERKLFAGVMSGTLGLIGLQERNHPQPLSLEPPFHPSSHPCRSSQSTKPSSLCYTAGSH